jgi:SAM-dependent methyltransferase
MKVRGGRYAGVLQIVQYNWRYYFASLCTIFIIGMLLWFRLLPRWGTALTGAAILSAFWSVSSLLASYYVYDYAAVTGWNWLPVMLSFPPRAWLNIHAGLDQSTAILARMFPDTGYVVLDIYDSRAMTEPSIARARRLRPSSQPAAASKFDALPIPDSGRDTVFVLFTAHEIRQPARRVEFFRELTRVLGGPGQLLLVEHLRDWKNFVAFGPGFLHFYSRAEWLRVARDVGLTVQHEQSVTPFVRCFLMCKARP